MSPTPSPLLRVAAAAARWALWVLALAWITVGLFWGGLHFVIVPRIGELRPWLEQQASAALGVQVQIGSVAARANGLIPSIELSQVRMLDQQGREVLRLPSVIAALSPRSALNRGFEQLYVEGPVLDVRRSADGRVWVAGLELSTVQDTDGSAADWLFSQTELALRQGTVHWTDELRGAPVLTLTGVDVVLRNRFLTHALRMDADPPADWGSRLSLSAVFKQPLLTTRSGNWREWKGEIHSAFERIDLAQLRPYLAPDLGVEHGKGALRAWLEVDRAELSSATVDVALSDVQLRLEQGLQPMALSGASGRLGVRQLAGGYEWFTEALAFDTQDGLHWPGGNVRMALMDAQGKAPAGGELKADRLDLAALAEIGQRLPLDAGVRALLARYAPRGLVEQLQSSWQGSISRPERFTVKGRITQLAIAAQQQPDAMPGVSGLDLDFDLNQASGKASVSMRSGSLEFPGVFDEPRVPIDQLSTELVWTVSGERIAASASNLKFSNADAQGEAQLKWQSADDATGAPGKGAGAPGVLDLQGSLSRVQGARVFRYLPRAMDKEVRDYLRQAVTAGTASNVKFKVKGDLRNFPFENAKQGDFKVTADIKNLSYAYAPNYLLPKDSLPWPVLTQVSAELAVEHGALSVKGAKGGVGTGGLQFSKADGVINNLYGTGASTVAVVAEAKGPLADVLGLVNASPLGAMTGKVLAKATATGPADYRIKLAVPLAAVERTTVQGTLILPGNDLQVSPETPRLVRLRGSMAFSETGFTISGMQARALGGDVRIDGGLSALASGAGIGSKSVPATLRLQGSATAEGLRQARELGFAARMALYASGSAAYTATLGVRSGIPELQITSSLSGMALSLPAPFTKAADAVLPVRLETQVVRSSLLPGAHLQDQLQFDAGRLASVVFVRDVSGAQAHVLRGAIGVGLASDEAAPLPAEGVVANVNVAQLDADAWSEVLGKVSGEAGTPATSVAAPGVVALAYLPTSMAVRSRELLMGGRKLKNVVIGGARDGLLWRANIDASELSGYVEYRQSTGPSAGRLYARLARLAIAQSAAQDVENILDEQPTSIPALDVVVDDFELRGKKLGRVEMEAVNLASGAVSRDMAREWRLNRFNIITPEAVLTASGNWTPVNTAAAPTGRSIKERRRTVLNFKLDVADAGDLLNRFGMPGVVRRGKGKIEGRVAWLGSPITLDYPSLTGSFNVDVQTGQFLKADPGIAKLLGVLSLQSLPRRLVLDFRDVFSEGFVFDFLRGDVTIEQGMARTNNLQMKGVNAAVLMEGQADIAKETQKLKVVVIPEINAGSASLIASTINPLVGLSTFLAQLILRRPLIEAATQEFQIDGTWVDPRVTKVERKN